MTVSQWPIPDNPDMSALYLVGDEDGGVGLGCRLCDRGGKPLAYWPGCCGNPYDDVPTMTTVDQLQHQMRVHARTVHR